MFDVDARLETGFEMNRNPYMMHLHVLLLLLILIVAVYRSLVLRQDWFDPERRSLVFEAWTVTILKSEHAQYKRMRLGFVDGSYTLLVPDHLSRDLTNGVL